MAKPASGTALDTGHALYTNLAHAWGLLEGSGTTSADSKGTKTLTLSSSGLWSSDVDGPTIVAADHTSVPLTLASSFTTGNTDDWSIAWRAKQTTSNDNGMIFGNAASTNAYVWMRGGSYLRELTLAGNNNFTGVTSFTALDDWVMTFDFESGVNFHHRVYKNGTEISGSPFDNGSIGNDMIITALMAGFSGSLGLEGTLSYCYIWTGRILSAAEAATISGNPYVLFQSGGGGLSIPVAMNQYRQRRS